MQATARRDRVDQGLQRRGRGAVDQRGQGPSRDRITVSLARSYVLKQMQMPTVTWANDG